MSFHLFLFCVINIITPREENMLTAHLGKKKPYTVLIFGAINSLNIVPVSIKDGVNLGSVCF